MNKIVVTGGCGFIGSNFIKHLLSSNKVSEIFNIDCLTYAGNPMNLSDISDDERYVFIKEDIRNKNRIVKILEDIKPDAVINFAAESHVDRSISSPFIFTETNIIGTHNLLEACKSLELPRFLQVSTDEVYGDLSLKDPAFTEETSLNPSSPYSASKASSDLLCLAYFRTYQTPLIITRCSNNFGPLQFPEKLIPLVINNAMNDRKIPIYGKGDNVRDWIFVEDHCRGIWDALTNGDFGEIYNFGGNAEKSNLQIVDAILNLLNKPSSLIEFVADRPGHDFRYAINFEKAHQHLGWKPKTIFEEGLEKTIEWYKSNKIWLEAIKSGKYKEYHS